MGGLATAPDLLDEPNVEPSPGMSSSDRADTGPADSSLIDLPLWYAALVAPAVRVEPAPPRPETGLYWRPIVVRWPIARRQRWGDRTNELQDAGFGWKEAECVAYEEIVEDLKLASR